MSFTYPSLLRPTTAETLVVDGRTVAIPKVTLGLRKWTGMVVQDNFGGKPLVDLAGRPLFAELAIYELFRLSGWEARWIETFGAPALRPKYYTDWLPAVARTAQLNQPVAEAAITGLLQQIAAANGNSYAGCWDVLGWHNATVLFAELKRYKKDRLQATQPRWLMAGLQEGLQPENFLLVEWDFL